MEQKAVSGGGVSNPSRGYLVVSLESNRRQDEEEKEEKKNRN
jgi:hypothetical protein